MAELDASLFARFAQPVKSVADYDAERNAAESNKLAMLLQRGQVSDREQARAQQQSLMNALRGVPVGGSDEDYARVYQGAGMPEQADRVRKSALERDKLRADVGETTAKTGKLTAEQSALVADQKWKAADRHVQTLAAAKTPDDVLAYIDNGIRDGILPMQGRAGALSKLQSMGVEGFKQAAFQAAIPNLDRFKTEAENARNALTNQTSASNNAATVGATLAGQQSVAATAAAGRRQADEHFKAAQSAPKYMETDAGLVSLPTRLTPGQAPVGTPVMGADGQALGKPLKALPPAVNTAIIGNAQSLYSLDKAIALLSGKDVDSAKGDKAATGWKGYVPQSLLNRFDSEGVDTRAEIGDIGSLKIHDRSGAAVTLSESPRLMPFIPLATDAPDVALRKLTRLKEEAAREQGALADTYSKEQGYRPSPVVARPAAAPKTASGATVSNW